MKKHGITFAVSFLLWLIFLLFGLPSNYFQTWTLSAQVWLCIFAFIIILPITYIVLLKVWEQNYFKSSLWLAFYASVPPMVCDYVYVGVMQGLGHSYLISHWYLTIFYFLVWIEIPAVGWIMDRRKTNLT